MVLVVAAFWHCGKGKRAMAELILLYALGTLVPVTGAVRATPSLLSSSSKVCLRSRPQEQEVHNSADTARSRPAQVFDLFCW